MNSQSLARGLAFFSVGLGLAELIAPRQLSRLIGLNDEHDNLLRLLGLREVGAGMGIMQGDPATFIWSRVGGDAMDLGLLAAAWRSRNNDRERLMGAIIAVAGVTALDILAGVLHTRNPAQPDWRVRRPNRTGLQRSDPVSMRQHSDRTMAEHQSGHLRMNGTHNETESIETRYSGGSRAMESREDQAVDQFEAGD